MVLAALKFFVSQGLQMSRSNVVLTIPEPRKFELVERPFPNCKAGYAIIRTEIAPVCLEGSRIWAEHDFEIHDDPAHLGHEGVGVIAEIHPGSSLKKGDRVIVFQGDHCGQCHSCRHGLSPTYCVSNLEEFGGAGLRGIEKHNDSESGGFAMARYRLAPLANLYRIPDALDFHHAAAANCSLGAGFSNQEIMNVKAGDVVLVGGIGFIGMGHIISALYRNATVIALIRNPFRQDLLRQIGVEHFVDPDDENCVDKIRSLTHEGQGVDHSVDGSGVAFYQQKLMAATRVYGTVNFSGHTAGARLEFSPLHHVIDPAHRMLGQHDVRAIDRERLIRALLNRDVQRMIEVMVTHEFPMSKAGDAFEIQVSKRCGKIYLHTQH